MKNFFFVFLAVAVLLGCAGCMGNDTTTETPTIKGKKADANYKGDLNQPGGASNQAPL